MLGLPRGGIPVAAAVAEGIGGELDVFVARKVGAPGQPELGVGAVAEGGSVVCNEEVAGAVGLGPAGFARAVPAVLDEVERRVRLYRGGRPLPVCASCSGGTTTCRWG